MARTLFAENVELYFYWCWDAQTIRSLCGRSEDYLAVFLLWFDLIPQGLDIVSNLWDVNLVEELMTMMVGDDFYPPAIDSDDLRIDVVTDCYKMLLLIVTRCCSNWCCYWLLEDKSNNLIVTAHGESPPNRPLQNVRTCESREEVPESKGKYVWRQGMAFMYLEMRVKALVHFWPIEQDDDLVLHREASSISTGSSRSGSDCGGRSYAMQVKKTMKIELFPHDRYLVCDKRKIPVCGSRWRIELKEGRTRHRWRRRPWPGRRSWGP